MPFEWNEAKRLANLAKHRLDFAHAEALFDVRPVLTYEPGGAMRFVSSQWAC